MNRREAIALVTAAAVVPKEVLMPPALQFHPDAFALVWAELPWHQQQFIAYADDQITYKELRNAIHGSTVVVKNPFTGEWSK